MQQTKVRVVYFDVGGVLAKNCDWYGFWGQWFDPSLQDAVEETRKDEWLKIRTNAEYPLEKFWSNILATAKVDPNVHNWKEVDRILRKDFGPYNFTLAMAERLQNRGYQIGIISNHVDEWFTEITTCFRFRDIFKNPDLVLSSCYVGCSKPEQEIFEIAYTRAKAVLPDLQKSEVLLIDDQTKNTSAATKFGFQTLLFDAEVNSQYFLVKSLLDLQVDASEHD